MSLLWFAPIALAGFALLVAPIVIHLLSRREQQPVPFPSLRFLRAARLSALTRRFVDDWPLLLIRLGIVAAAVVALGGPLFVTEGRRASWGARVARAIVLTPRADVPAQELTSAFRSSTFTADIDRFADTLSAAVAWLEAQPPARREIVVIGDLRASMLSSADLAQVPSHVGVRFLLRTPEIPDRDIAFPMLIRTPARVAARQLQVRLEDNATHLVGSSPLSSDAAEALQVRAAPAEQAIADAALRAVLHEGLVLDRPRERRVVVAWRGADVSDLTSHEGSERERNVQPAPSWVNQAAEKLAYPARFVRGTLLVQLDAAASDDSAAVALESIARTVFADAHAPLEPRPVAAADLATWTRPPGGIPPSARPEDEGDRRGMWALALLLMCVEQFWRRQRARPAVSTTASEEARVA